MLASLSNGLLRRYIPFQVSFLSGSSKFHGRLEINYPERSGNKNKRSSIRDIEATPIVDCGNKETAPEGSENGQRAKVSRAHEAHPGGVGLPETEN